MRTAWKVSLIVLLVMAWSLAAFAQGAANENSGSSMFQAQKPNVSLRSMSLLDPSRFTMHQESVFSYSSSAMSGSNLMGMYINTMEYRFNMPITMRLKVAYQNNMGSLFSGKGTLHSGQPGMDAGRVFIPSFDMVYQPTKNMSISFRYRDFSGMQPTDSYGMGGYSPYGYRHYYDPYGLYR